jgi:voltage-gated potassium channel
MQMGMELAVSDQFTRVANSPGRLFITFVLLMLVASVGYSVAESTGFLDAIYWAIITATTLGYGDFSPHTGPGKVLTIGLICSTVFIFIPTITANLASKLIVNRDAFTHEEQEEIKAALIRVEALLDERAKT